MSQADYRYWAFISYSHQDHQAAQRLHRQLERYRVPRRLVGSAVHGAAVPHRFGAIFRDREELPSSAELDSVINEALRASRFLIVICSPNAAASRWVNEEILYFKSLGREARVLPYIIDGEPHASHRPQLGLPECFPPALRFRIGGDGQLSGVPAHPIAADARIGHDGPRKATLKLIAGLLGVGFDELRQRERSRQRLRRFTMTALAAVALLVAVGGWQAYRKVEAQRRLHERIETLFQHGRSDLLDGQLQRAAAYLGTAYSLGLDTPALRFMLAQAMRAVDAQAGPEFQVGGVVLRATLSSDEHRLFATSETEQRVSGWLIDVDNDRLLKEFAPLPRAPKIVRFFDNGRRLLVAGYEKSWNGRYSKPVVEVWDVDSGTERLHLSGYGGDFGSPLSPDGRSLAVVAADGVVHIVATDTGATRLSLRDPQHTLSAAGFSPDGRQILTGDRNGGAAQWDARSGRMLRRLDEPATAAINNVMFSPDGGRMLGFSAHADLHVWNARTGQLELAFAADSQWLAGAQFSADGSRLLTIGRQGFKLWSLRRGELLFSRAESLEPQAVAALNPSGTRAVFADGVGRSDEYWDMVSSRMLTSLDQPLAAPLTIASVAASAQFTSLRTTFASFTQDGSSLLLGDDAGRVRLLPSPVGLLADVQLGDLIVDAKYAPDGRRIALADRNGDVDLWQPGAAQALQTLRHAHKRALAVAWNHAGTRLAAGYDDGSVALIDPQHPDDTRVDSARGASIYSLEFSADDRYVVSTTYYHEPNSEVRVWDGDSGALIAGFDMPAGSPRAVLFPHGIVTYGSVDGWLRWLDPRTWTSTPLIKLGKGSWDVLLVAGPDDRRVYASGRNHALDVVDLQQRRDVDHIELPLGETPRCMAIGKDGRTVYIGTDGGSLLKVDLNHHEVQSFRNLANANLMSMEWLIADRLLLLNVADGRVRVWDVQREAVVAELAEHKGQISAMSISPDRQRLLTSGYDGVAREWRLAFEQRTPQQIQRRLACYAGWRVSGVQATAVAGDPQACRSNAKRSP